MARIPLVLPGVLLVVAISNALTAPQTALRRCLPGVSTRAAVHCVASPLEVLHGQSSPLMVEEDGAAPSDAAASELDSQVANEVLDAIALDEAQMAVAAEAVGNGGEVVDSFEKDPHAAVVDVDDPDRPPISMFNVDERTVALLAEKGINNFTPIQAKSYDMLRAGRDMLGRSRTGTGKTLAFSLPLVQRLAEEQRNERPERGRLARMIVLAPTRELAKQVGEVISMLGQPHRLQVHVFVGGTPYPPQQRALRNGIDVLVGTPGRIIDHLTNGDLDLSNVASVVLDEADEMLNMVRHLDRTDELLGAAMSRHEPP